MDALAEIFDYNDLHSVMRDRAVALQLSLAGVDNVAGLADGHASKILSPSQIKGIGNHTLGPLLQALGIKLVAIEDPNAMARFAAKREKNRSPNAGQRNERIIPRAVKAAAEVLLHQRSVDLGAKGGRARAKALPPEERARVASEAASARWARKTPRQRKRAMARLTAARRRKRKAVTP